MIEFYKEDLHTTIRRVISFNLSCGIKLLTGDTGWNTRNFKLIINQMSTDMKIVNFIVSLTGFIEPRIQLKILSLVKQLILFIITQSNY